MNQTDQVKLELLKQAAIAADAVVRSQTPGTVPSATSEQIQVAKLYMMLAVPGFILALFDEIERLQANTIISLSPYQVRELLEMAESSGEPEGDELIIVKGDGACHSGPGLYAYFRECPEEGARFIGDDEEDQQRGNKLAEAFEAAQEIQP